MKRYYIFTTVLLTFVWIGTSVQYSASNSTGGPFKNTGSPGDGANNTCAKAACHVGTVNSGPGSVSVDLSDIPATGYKTGDTYSIGIDVDDADRTTIGFQLTVENSSGQKVGTLVSNSNTKLVGTGGNWITHNAPNSNGQWSIDWTAPTTAEDTVYFYVSGNAANGNGSTSGDRVYTGSAKAPVDPTVGFEKIERVSGWTLLENPVRDVLRINSEESSNLELYSLDGKIQQRIRLNRGVNDIALNNQDAGLFILRDMNTGKSVRLIVE